MWGRVSVDALAAANPGLLAVDDPVDTMMRFRVRRAAYCCSWTRGARTVLALDWTRS